MVPFYTPFWLEVRVEVKTFSDAVFSISDPCLEGIVGAYGPQGPVTLCFIERNR